jgi:hypothetical protein
MVRGWWPDRNPLRRRSHRVEAAVGAGLVVVFFAGAPLLGIAAGDWMHNVAENSARTQKLAIETQAVLLHSAPPAMLAARALQSMTDELARWTAPHGVVRTGQVPVPAGTEAGTTVAVWTDAEGRLTSPPLSAAVISDQALMAGVLTPVAFGAVLAAGWLVVRRLLLARRLAWWEAQWSATGPRWTSRR